MILHLLTKVFNSQDGALALDGRLWRLMPYDLSDGVMPDFICISYTWGSGRAPSPFHKGFDVSDRTVPVLKAAARHRPQCQRIWVDAFCVPREEPERALTLESMGYIYAQAQEVIAVLSPSILPALTQMKGNAPLSTTQLSLLEKDEWVTRAWTYQETVNARTLSITCDGDGATPLIAGQDLINHVGHALSKQPTPHHLSRRAQNPGLDALEDLVDYLTADSGARSAMQVMAKMDRRTQQNPADHFYAMIGALSFAHASSLGAADASEAFMLVCEAKGDYSFVFSAARREAAAGRRWRPARGGHVPALLQWDAWGGGQAGGVTAHGLRLGGVVRLGMGDLGAAAGEFVRAWLRHIGFLLPVHADDLANVLRLALVALRLMGFAGSGDCLATAAGLFFPYESVASSQVEYIVASSSIMWVFGCPGMLCYTSGSTMCYSAGVLVGCLGDLPVTSEVLI